MSGELRAVSRAAHNKALSRKTKAIALAKAVGTVAAVGTLAVGVGALAHMLYSTPPEESEGEQISAMPRNAQEFVQKQKEFSGEAARHITNLAVQRLTRLNAGEGDRKGRTLTPQQQRELAKTKFQLGRLYYAGRGVALDRKVALDLYEQAATIGNADAQVTLGRLYQVGHAYGREFRKDTDKAAAWYRLAMAHMITNFRDFSQSDTLHDDVKANWDASTGLLTLYDHGGGDSDSSDDDAWIQATRAYAQTAAAAAKRNGFRTIDDVGAALAYGAILDFEYNKAHIQSHARATTTVEQHPAFEWYTGASTPVPQHRPADAQFRLANIYFAFGTDDERTIGAALYDTAAFNGSAEAMHSAAANLFAQLALSRHAQGHGLTAELNARINGIFEKAARRGNVASMVELGIAHRTGATGSKSIALAMRWLELAIAEGSAEASFEYGLCLQESNDARDARDARDASDSESRDKRALALFITAVDYGLEKARRVADSAHSAHSARSSAVRPKSKKNSASATQKAKVPFNIEQKNTLSGVAAVAPIPTDGNAVTVVVDPIEPALTETDRVPATPTATTLSSQMIRAFLRISKFPSAVLSAVKGEARAVLHVYDNGTHVIHVAAPTLSGGAQGSEQGRPLAVARLAGAYTSVLAEFDSLVRRNQHKTYKLRFAPIPVGPEWEETMPSITADAIRKALDDRSEALKLTSENVTMCVFEGYSVVIEYKIAFGLIP